MIGMAMSLPVPPDLHSLLIRTDYSDDAAWETVRELLRQPDEDGFIASLVCVEDLAYDGATAQDLWAMAADEPEITFAVVADDVTMADPEHPVLVVDLYGDVELPPADECSSAKSPRSSRDRPAMFRAMPNQVPSITANLEIANMDFHEFADNVDGDGVFRGFHI